MKGLINKLPLFILTISLTSWAFATNNSIDHKVKSKITTYTTSAGCMACHQSDVTPAPVKKNNR